MTIHVKMVLTHMINKFSFATQISFLCVLIYINFETNSLRDFLGVVMYRHCNRG